MRTSSRPSAISSSSGAIARHGAHHGAQKSTRIGVSLSMTSAWKLSSVTSVIVPAIDELLFTSPGVAAHGDRGEPSRLSPTHYTK